MSSQVVIASPFCATAPPVFFTVPALASSQSVSVRVLAYVVGVHEATDDPPLLCDALDDGDDDDVPPPVSPHSGSIFGEHAL